MASIYKRKRSEPIAEGARIVKDRGRLVARWTTKRGKIRSAPVNGAGDRVIVESEKYIIGYKDGDGRRRTVAVPGDLTAAKRYAKKFEVEAGDFKHGLRDSRAERLKESSTRPLEDHLTDFAETMEGRGVTLKHIANTVAYIRQTLAGCGFKTAADIDAVKVEAHKADLLRDGRSRSNINHHLTAFKSFTKWLHRNDRIARDPMPQVAKLNAKVDRRHVRRALSDDELAHLFRVTGAGGTVRRLTGPERVMAYRVAMETGLRASEVGSLTPRSFNLADLDTATVSVRAAYSKRRREDVVPILRSLAEAVAAFIASKPQDAPLFKMPHKPAEMLRVDLEAAGIPYADEEGRVMDFHGLRHTFITRLARSGVMPAEAKALARHSTITLTMDHYTHTLIADERAALERVPDIDATPATNETMAATGTDGAPADDQRIATDFSARKSARNSSVPTCHSVTQHVASDDAESAARGERAPDDKSLQASDFDAASHDMSQHDICEDASAPRRTRTFNRRIKSPRAILV